MKIALIGSSGGHLNQLLQLESFWKDKPRFWVTFDKTDARSALQNETKYFAYYPTNRNIVNLLKNTILAFKVIWKERPDLIISTGAGVAVPFFFVGKLLGAKTVYIEVFDRVDSATLTGRLVYHVTDLFLVQWPEMLKVYKKAKYIGRLY
ncbi:MAG: UDP-N-acetylglucosamine--LPS N-acetylglucosamine transferase [Weissella confusa]|nr:UDP-N-acetylglucosamine--LPS N-acetylglucosamine transferase [Weissella confusa]